MLRVWPRLCLLDSFLVQAFTIAFIVGFVENRIVPTFHPRVVGLIGRGSGLALLIRLRDLCLIGSASVINRGSAVAEHHRQDEDDGGPDHKPTDAGVKGDRMGSTLLAVCCHRGISLVGLLICVEGVCPKDGNLKDFSGNRKKKALSEKMTRHSFFRLFFDVIGA